MPSYTYSAVNKAGRTIKGSIAADNEVDLELRLQQIGLDLVQGRAKKERKVGGSTKIKLRDMIVLCLHLEQLDKAGVPLLESIADIRDSTDSAKLRDILTGVYESVKNGEMFSKALSHYPRVFNEVFVGLISAGEKTGNLSGSFQHLADHLKWADELRRKVKKAMAYPILLVIVMTIVISVLMIFVVPKLINFITSQGFEIPLHTRALIVVSHAFVDYWYLVLGLPVIVIVAILVLYRTSESFAYMMDGFILKLPVLGPTVRKINMARFTHFFSIMFRSGIDILESLQAAKNVVGNRVIQESITLVRTSVTEGNSLTQSLRLSNQFPNLVIRMFKVGEDSGNMTDAMENINFFYNREVNDAVDGMVGFIQPALTVVMGLLIFWVIAAVFGPLYQSFSKMKF